MNVWKRQKKGSDVKAWGGTLLKEQVVIVMSWRWQKVPLPGNSK